MKSRSIKYFRQQRKYRRTVRIAKLMAKRAAIKTREQRLYECIELAQCAIIAATESVKQFNLSMNKFTGHLN